MAKKLLALPISARLNIVEWLEKLQTSRDYGFSLKQSTIDIFDKGNEYNSNIKIDEFNSYVEIIIDALKKNGIDVPKTNLGRYSLNKIMLDSLKIENFTQELKDFVFDKNLTMLNLDDKKIVTYLDKIFKEEKTEYIFKNKKNQSRYFGLFAKHENLPAIKWLIEKCGVENFDLKNSEMMINFKILQNKIGDDAVVDFFISTGIITHSLKSKNCVYVLIDLNRLLTKKSKDKLISFLEFTDEHKGSDMLYVLTHLVVLDKMPEAVKIVDLSENEIMKIVEHVATLTENQYDTYESTIRELMYTYPTFIKKLLSYGDLEFSKKLINSIPELSIFMW